MSVIMICGVWLCTVLHCARVCEPCAQTNYFYHYFIEFSFSWVTCSNLILGGISLMCICVGYIFPKIVALFGRLLIIANLAIALLFILICFASEAFWSLNFKNIKNHSSKFEKNHTFLYICSYGCIPQLYYVSRWNMLRCELHKNENFVNFLIITNACTVHHYQSYEFIFYVVH